tara:strand:- start:245 stop:724 length:480 start_codon:yes stop_codon:yes gene_type:complete
MSESKTRTMQEWLDAYGVSHQNPLNKKIHWICVPLIFLSIVGLLWSIPKPWNVDYVWLNFATIAVIPVFLFYARLSFSLTIGMMLWCCFCFLFCNYYHQFIEFPLWQTSIIVFVLAWIGQFYGHKIEGVKPSFFEDLQFLMIGPAWLMSFIYNRLGIRY